MKYSISIVLNIGNYKNVTLGVSDADSFFECKEALQHELDIMGHRPKALFQDIKDSTEYAE